MTKNNCKYPLTLRWDSVSGQYKVDKPNIDTLELVDYDVAKQLLDACEWAQEEFQKLAEKGLYPESMLAVNGGKGMMPLINAINNAKLP